MSMTVFKAYDIRGIYPDQINNEFAFKLGLAFAKYLEKQNITKKIVVGQDFRFGSDELATNFTKACISAGVDVTRIGICSTPALLYMTSIFDAGVMITASHNPKEYNGFKFCLKNGRTIGYEDGINEIEEFFNNLKPEDKKDWHNQGKYEVMDLDVYLNGIISKFNHKEFSKLNVVIDSGNGAAATTYPKIFKALNIKYFPVFLGLDHNFSGRGANPTLPNSVDELKKQILATKADLGIAFDGDADRIVVVDDKGNVIDASVLGKILAKEYFNKNEDNKHFINETNNNYKKIDLEDIPELAIYHNDNKDINNQNKENSNNLKEKPKFVLDLRLSKSLSEFIIENGGEVIISKVGQVNIKRKMFETGASLGVEVSGHIMHKPIFNVDDAVYSALVVMKILTQEKKENKEIKLSDINKSLQKYFQASEDLKIEDGSIAIQKLKEKYYNSKLDFTDGVTANFEDCWFNARASNTEPILRLTVEGNTKEISKNKLKEIQEVINLANKEKELEIISKKSELDAAKK